MRVMLAKPFKDNPGRRNFRQFTVRKVKAGTRVRVTTWDHENGTPKTTMFRDFPDLGDAVRWYWESQDDDMKDGWEYA